MLALQRITVECEEMLLRLLGRVPPALQLLRQVKHLVWQFLGRDPRHRIQIDCPREFHGGIAHGGWTICPTSISQQSIVYSLGVGDDISFDLSLIEGYGVNVFAFDPTPESINWVRSQTLPQEFHLFECGIADHDGIVKLHPPENPKNVSYTLLHQPSTSDRAIEVEVHRLRTIMEKLGHQRIDILKMDIEGAEYCVIQDILGSKIDISQILVEFHHYFPNVAVSQTIRAVQHLNEHGYKIFHISARGAEYSFIRT